ncbi:hypothetical protein Poli38472_014068 [Pythium oligandrum]|uniref:Acetyl-CoA C-acetyltransferase n=1 Tax=Pythium oligandrum TaxID=41045 RepID=A0A8K1CN87_PYTOL|nr:hypothetical protein Poli38472_014068 [Pythium oligandrum]|eukprot:TMW66756.1 hypothetical protein Poli38472_014068 [Pythium oligandrum]
MTTSSLCKMHKKARVDESHRDVCVVGVARTPIGAFQGKLSGFKATELAGFAIKEAVQRAGVAPADVEELILGHVLAAGCGQSPAKQAAVSAGIPATVPCTTVNKVCASGMKAIMFASQSILLGLRDVVVVGGMESMSQAPHLSGKARSGARFGELVFTDAIQTDGLNDAFDHVPMGDLAEQCAFQYGFDRESQDRYAAETYRRAVAATRGGKFANEIVPVEVKTRKETVVVTEDEEAVAREVNYETLSKVRTCFKAANAEFGTTVTPANASTLNDGAAALVLMSRAKAEALGLTSRILAVVRGFGDAEQEARAFTTSPSLAIPKALAHAQIQPTDVDFYEINEAFSVVSLANAKLLSLDPAKVNVYGGAVSLGHPLGCSGARIVVTLCSVLQQEQGRYGCAAICNGGGGASALVLERP